MESVPVSHRSWQPASIRRCKTVEAYEEEKNRTVQAAEGSDRIASHRYTNHTQSSPIPDAFTHSLDGAIQVTASNQSTSTAVAHPVATVASYSGFLLVLLLLFEADSTPPPPTYYCRCRCRCSGDELQPPRNLSRPIPTTCGLCVWRALASPSRLSFHYILR